MVADAILDPLTSDDEAFEQDSTPKLKRSRFPKLDKLVELQREAEKRITNGSSDKDAASLMRAWKDLEMLRRIMLNKPITVEAAKPKFTNKRRGFGLTRSIDAQIVDIAPEPSPIVTNLSPNSAVDSETPTNAS